MLLLVAIQTTKDGDGNTKQRRLITRLKSREFDEGSLRLEGPDEGLGRSTRAQQDTFGVRSDCYRKAQMGLIRAGDSGQKHMVTSMATMSQIKGAMT